MSNTNYLDELDDLLDNPSDSIIDVPTHASPVPANSMHSDTTDEARDTWASVIENASHSLQEGTRTVQDAVYKNLELAKTQNESIKELVDAASGWRHATRQAVQEVATTKKNIIILTVISGIIALAGFGTTIGVMLQSRSGLAAMSNAVLENVDEHQTLVSRTLTLKMDEMAATIERMEGVIDQLIPSNNANKVQANASAPEVETEATSESTVTPTELVLPIEKALASETNKTTVQPPVATVSTPPVNMASHGASLVEMNDALLLATAPLNKQMTEKLTQVTGQLSQLEQNWKMSNETVQKQLSLIPTAVDEKLSPRLQKLATMPTTPSTPTTAAPTIVTQDNKAVLEQLTRLRQDLAEIRQLQTVLKEQMIQLKQGQSREAAPYQYRNPEVERYPR